MGNGQDEFKKCHNYIRINAGNSKTTPTLTPPPSNYILTAPTPSIPLPTCVCAGVTGKTI